jgi:hypothetical protein
MGDDTTNNAALDTWEDEGGSAPAPTVIEGIARRDSTQPVSPELSLCGAPIRVPVPSLVDAGHGDDVDGDLSCTIIRGTD